jgi:hypothetical protein
MKREQVNQLAEAAKNDPAIKPYRSFCWNARPSPFR